jgi:hypothetical protein
MAANLDVKSFFFGSQNHELPIHEFEVHKTALRLRHLPHRLLFLRRLSKVHGPTQDVPASCTTSIRRAGDSTHQLSRANVMDGGPSEV